MFATETVVPGGDETQVLRTNALTTQSLGSTFKDDLDTHIGSPLESNPCRRVLPGYPGRGHFLSTGAFLHLKSLPSCTIMSPLLQFGRVAPPPPVWSSTHLGFLLLSNPSIFPWSQLGTLEDEAGTQPKPLAVLVSTSPVWQSGTPHFLVPPSQLPPISLQSCCFMTKFWGA